ncbi:transposase [Pelomonas sp. UHG3]|uniref:Transposase n=1 Tax=Roseateles hydrophilus TaxID=2975054 RepID=A0ACC6CDL7_9BURK|nr:transposase [Pelomonas sp. UHG3]MCY4746447.1 transposase [Pelomonas sp. UHG3]
MTTLTLSIPSALTMPQVPTAAALVRVKGTRAKYTPQQKLQALLMAEQGRPQAAIARELGILPNTVYSWVHAAREALKASQRDMAAQPDAPVGTLRADLLALRGSLSRRLDALERERETILKTIASVRDALDL